MRPTLSSCKHVYAELWLEENGRGPFARMRATTEREKVTEDPWAVTAYHEAGHVVSYLHFGWRFGTVKIYQTDNGKVLGSVLSPAGTYDCFARAIICMAGPISEEKLTGVSLDEQPGSYIDRVMAKDALSRVTVGDGPADIESIIPFTRLMIDHEWPHIALIAGELVRRKELDYEEVIRLTR
jgi:hypothetical protein